MTPTCCCRSPGRARRSSKHGYGVPADRVVVVPDATTPPDGPLPPRDATTRTVVYAGQLYRWKGVDTLLAAMAQVPEAHLVVLGGRGSPDDPDLDACRDLACAARHRRPS